MWPGASSLPNKPTDQPTNDHRFHHMHIHTTRNTGRGGRRLLPRRLALPLPAPRVGLPLDPPPMHVRDSRPRRRVIEGRGALAGGGGNSDSVVMILCECTVWCIKKKQGACAFLLPLSLCCLLLSLRQLCYVAALSRRRRSSVRAVGPTRRREPHISSAAYNFSGRRGVGGPCHPQS